MATCVCMWGSPSSASVWMMAIRGDGHMLALHAHTHTHTHTHSPTHSLGLAAKYSIHVNFVCDFRTLILKIKLTIRNHKIQNYNILITKTPVVRGTCFCLRGGRTLVALECGRALCMHGWLQRCQEIAPSTQHALCVHKWLRRCQEISPSTQTATLSYTLTRIVE